MYPFIRVVHGNMPKAISPAREHFRRLDIAGGKIYLVHRQKSGFHDNTIPKFPSK